MRISIKSSLMFNRISKNLETLQEFKGPLLKTFDKLICGNPDTDEDAEFCYIQPVREAGIKRKSKELRNL